MAPSALLVEIVTAMIAVWALFDARAASKKALGVERGLARLESVREFDRQTERNAATVRAAFEGTRLLVTNAGPQPAYDVAVLVDGRQIANDDRFARHTTPPRELAAGAFHSYSFADYDCMWKRVHVELTWITPDGAGHRWEGEVPMW